MDTKLETLFYVGILVPTLITIFVFIGFLLCLYKRNLQRNMTKLSNRALPATPGLSKSRNSKSFEKFDKCSQHSADSAIDLGDIETSLEEKIAVSGLVLDTRCLDNEHHSYQNEAMQLTTEAEIHGGMGLLKKGYYPSHEKLNEEIHSQVKIYEKMSDVQKVALQIQQKNESLKPSEKRLVTAAAHKQFAKLQQTEKVMPRYTSTSKLIPATSPINNNQLDRSSNYASYSPSWYREDISAVNNHNMEIYRSSYHSASTWKPNITAASSSSNTDNSSVESSRV